MALDIQEPLDSGSVNLSLSTVDDGASLITIQPRLTYAGTWLWTCAEITGTTGRTPTIDVLSANPFNAIDQAVRNGAWAYDPDGEWFDFASVTFPTSPSRIRFVHNAAFEQDTVYFAYWPMYRWARVEAAIETWKPSAFVSPTASADADLVVGTLPSISNGFGRTCPAANLHGFVLTDPAALGSKNVALLTCGNHPGETPCQYSFNAAIDFLLSSDVRAVFLRQHWVFYCYPNVNPQGRYGGLFRNCPDELAEDHNRIWDTTGSAATIDTMKAVIVADTGGVVHASIDFHSYNIDYGDGSARLDVSLVDSVSEFQHPAWLAAYRQHEPTHDLVVRVNEGNFREWAKSAVNSGDSLRLACAAEVGSIASYGIPEYQRHGRWLMYTLAHATERGVFPVTAIDQGGRVYYS